MESSMNIRVCPLFAIQMTSPDAGLDERCGGPLRHLTLPSNLRQGRTRACPLPAACASTPASTSQPTARRPANSSVLASRRIRPPDVSDHGLVPSRRNRIAVSAMPASTGANEGSSTGVSSLSSASTDRAPQRSTARGERATAASSACAASSMHLPSSTSCSRVGAACRTPTKSLLGPAGGSFRRALPVNGPRTRVERFELRISFRVFASFCW